MGATSIRSRIGIINIYPDLVYIEFIQSLRALESGASTGTTTDVAGANAGATKLRTGPGNGSQSCTTLVSIA